jgi:hypothetical protein
VSGGLSAAEEVIDRQAKIEQFRGREIDFATGRIVLHAWRCDVHEQLHWLEGPGLDEATAEASRRWPDPPPPPAGAYDARSTWLHMSVCALESRSMGEIIGPALAATELRNLGRYSWIYGQIFEEPSWFARFLHRHGLHVPQQPPVPRRYCGADWWTSS